MQPHLSIPFPPLHSIDDDDDDDDESPSDSSHSTPHSSQFHLWSSEAQYANHCCRPHSFDSGYFSMMGKESPLSCKPSGAGLFPINDPTDTAHLSPKREGVIMNFLRKRKKSVILSSSLDLDPHRNLMDDPVRLIHPFPFSVPPPRSTARDSSIEVFEKQDRFVVRRGMKHHPYSRDDAPYMLAYDRTLLDNDRFSELLLRRLNQNDSPSFHDFSHAVPKTILDLGCGPGSWVVDAATFWPSSQVIGFDLVDPVRLRGGAQAPSNVQWKQGNFVKYRLPFPKNTFDLVRMANLSLCVPYERWGHVISEVRRVLAQGGRLELIDDHLYFPYTKRPPQLLPDSPTSSPQGQSSPSSFDDRDDDETEVDSDAERQDGENDDDDDDDGDDDFMSTKSHLSSFVDMSDADDSPPELPYDPVSEWNRNVNDSTAVEKLFEEMLSRKFSVHPRPSRFLDRVIDKVFGRYNQSRLHEFNLYLAPPSSQDSDGSSVGSSDGHGSAGLKKAVAKWVTTVDWDHHKDKEKKQRTTGDRSSEESFPGFSLVPDMISAKAAGRLGVSPTPSHSHAAQSPGLIVWPSTFIPISPFELEMHACKHMHSLIGCKAALTEFLQDVAQRKNLSFDEQMVDDLIWDYESFRRKRFNWPSECPESRFGLERCGNTTTPRSNTFHNPVEGSHQSHPRTSSGSMGAPPDPLFPREKLDFVRSIRVYSATKVDEEIHVL